MQLWAYQGDVYHPLRETPLMKLHLKLNGATLPDGSLKPVHARRAKSLPRGQQDCGSCPDESTQQY